MEPKPRNERQQPVTMFCLAMEELRRTDAGRVKNAKDLVDHFFPYDSAEAVDRLFVHLPREVRAPIVASWGIRGAKAALRDDDARIRSVVQDAMLAGDIDPTIFEEGITPGIIADWVPLDEWWSFWRSGKVSGLPAQKALGTARSLGLFDDGWFLENLDGRGGRLKGTDTIADTLSKEQIVSWVRGVHASGDASPAGIVAAIGWDVIVAKTAQEALLFSLDALAKKLGLVKAPSSLRADAGASTPLVRGSEVPGIAMPDFPIDEKGFADLDEPVSVADSLPIQASSLQGDSGSQWPELAAPGDMGYALAQPGAMKAAGIKPSFGGLNDDDEVTPHHQGVSKGAK